MTSTTTPTPEKVGLLPLDGVTKEKKAKVFAAGDKAKRAPKPKAEKKASSTPFVDSLVENQQAAPAAKKERKARAPKPAAAATTDFAAMIDAAVQKAVQKVEKAHAKEIASRNRAEARLLKVHVKATKDALKGTYSEAEVRKAEQKAYATGYREGSNAANRAIKAALAGRK